MAIINHYDYIEYRWYYNIFHFKALRNKEMHYSFITCLWRLNRIQRKAEHITTDCVLIQQQWLFQERGVGGPIIGPPTPRS